MPSARTLCRTLFPAVACLSLGLPSQAQADALNFTCPFSVGSDRQQNVFTEMFASLKALAKMRGVRLIYAEVSEGNVIGRTTMAKLKAVPITVNYEFVVS